MAAEAKERCATSARNIRLESNKGSGTCVPLPFFEMQPKVAKMQNQVGGLLGDIRVSWDKHKEVNFMGFAENLRELRKERGLSQEDLAELLDVSRQAVSKWEQGMGYPEVETLLLLAGKLKVSLDSLMAVEIAKEGREEKSPITGTILISSPHENVVVSCYKVGTSGRMLGGEGSPQYFLFGVSSGGASFWGEPTTFLGWYADKEQITKEVEEIRQALFQGEQTYQLKYSMKTERRWGRIKQVEE